ncbi:hypothetical protein HN865_02040 [Candidatus Woesearchaeota archaeon]|jgi:hypothetical protein|nr:hypothetical protein [Candidatus Woesearchaeota archaeon]MBT7237613.1 hypothetical protein [Candidatus Woesearchaeota archaeon]
MKEDIITNKERSSGLYNLALDRIKECGSSINEIIPFPKIFSKLCRSFSIKKREVWEVLFILRDFNMIRIVAGHGVVIKDDYEAT